MKTRKTGDARRRRTGEPKRQITRPPKGGKRSCRPKKYRFCQPMSLLEFAVPVLEALDTPKALAVKLLLESNEIDQLDLS